MRVLSFEAQNIMRLSVFFYSFPDDESVTIIGGLNGHGKTSALRALAMALGGKKLCPDEPLKRGQNSGFVTVDLDDFIVTRRFWRKEVFACEADHQHTDDCDVIYGDVDSELTIKSRDGASYKSPQAMLDKIITDLTFDPLSFLELQPREQRAMVSTFAKIDFTILDTKRTAALAQAREAEGVVKRADRDVVDGEQYPDAPAELVNVDALLQQLANAEQLGTVAAAAEKAVEAKRRAYEATVEALKGNVLTIAGLEKQLADARAIGVELEAVRQREIVEGKTLGETAKAAKAAVPDTANLRQQLADANVINGQVAANVRYAAILQAQKEAAAELATAKAAIATIDAQKTETLARATFPVAGLGFTDDGLTFDGLPFEQASYAQQLRVAVAMGFAYKPKLKLLLIKHGNALDSTSLQLIEQLASEADAQVVIERVAESPEGVQVFITDGVSTVVGQEEVA